MKYAALFPLAIALTTTFAVGQATYQKPLHIDPTKCPVGLQVRHGGGLPSAVGAVGPCINGKPLNGEVPSVQNQETHLTFANPSSGAFEGFKTTFTALHEK